MAQRDAAFTQPGGFSDARQLPQLRRVHRPRRHYHFARRAHGEALAAAPQLHAHAALAFEHQLLGLRARHHMQVRAIAPRSQKRFGRVPPPAAPLVHFEVATAEVVAPVEVLHARNAFLLSRAGKCFQDVPAQALGLDAPLAPGAVEFVGAAVIVLAALEDRQHLVPAPGRVAR
ncbi:hypothetical protein G6F32_015151 [Rhizopus arrhizus]|nr:hypothetical protein G6F32_015151 [Rhizopus arrhizus]